MADAVAMSAFHRQSGTGDLCFSIVIPSLGSPGLLEETLIGIAAQSRLPELVVVVDAAGNDEVKEFLSAFDKRFPVSYQQATEASAAM